MANDTLLEHVADIVSAHVTRNAVSPADLPGLIIAVHGALARLGKPTVPVEAPLEPAVSVRASVKADRLTCLDCGVKLKMLKRHLGTDHNLTPAQYRARWNLPESYPMVAPDYAAVRAELAKKIGLGRKLGTKMVPASNNQSVTAKPRKKLSVAIDSIDPASLADAPTSQ